MINHTTHPHQLLVKLLLRFMLSIFCLLIVIFSCNSYHEITFGLYDECCVINDNTDQQNLVFYSHYEQKRSFLY